MKSPLRSPWRQATAGIVLMAALSVQTQTQAQTFTFTGNGAVAPTGAPDAFGNLPVAVVNTSYSFTGYSGVWTLLAPFTFNLGTQAGSGAFSFSQGANSLSGTLATAAAPVAQGPGFELTYTVTSGTGVFAGLVGGGSSLVRLLGDISSPPTPYLEAGIFALAVPEPATWLLMGGGALALAWRRRTSRPSTHA
jgi:hypothetical protein